MALNALVPDGVTTVDKVCTAYLPDVPNLGPVRTALIRRKLATLSRTSGKGDQP